MHEIQITHKWRRIDRTETNGGNYTTVQGNRVLTKEHLEEVVLDPTGFKQVTLDTPF